MTSELFTIDIMPGYRSNYDAEKDQIVFNNRKSNKAAKALFNDHMNALFKPSKLTKKQTEFDL